MVILFREARRSSRNLGELSSSQCLQLGQMVQVEVSDSQCKNAVLEAKKEYTLYELAGIAVTALNILAFVLHALWKRWRRNVPTPSLNERPQPPAVELVLEHARQARPSTPIQKRTRRKTAEVRFYLEITLITQSHIFLNHRLDQLDQLPH